MGRVKSAHLFHSVLITSLNLYHVCLLHCAGFSVLEPGYCPVRLGMTTGRLQSGVNTLQGFKEDKRNRVTPGEAPACFRELGKESTIVIAPFTAFLDIFAIAVYHQIQKKLKNWLLVCRVFSSLFCGNDSFVSMLCSAGGPLYPTPTHRNQAEIEQKDRDYPYLLNNTV